MIIPIRPFSDPINNCRTDIADNIYINPIDDKKAETLNNLEKDDINIVVITAEIRMIESEPLLVKI